MIKKIACMTLIVALSVLFTGCTNDDPQAGSADEPVKTFEEFKAEADEDITSDNWQEELDRLEQEIEQDE